MTARLIFDTLYIGRSDIYIYVALPYTTLRQIFRIRSACMVYHLPLHHHCHCNISFPFFDHELQQLVMLIRDVPIVFAEVVLEETCDNSDNLNECLGHRLPMIGNSCAGQPAATSAPATRAHVTGDANDTVQDYLSLFSECAPEIKN